jgi:hypothetical protein
MLGVICLPVYYLVLLVVSFGCGTWSLMLKANSRKLRGRDKMDKAE